MGEVISEQQRQLNQALHAENDLFGVGMANLESGRLPAALRRMHELGCCNSILDYGTGKGALVQRLREELPPYINVQGYDPAVQRFSHRPSQPFDVVTCVDVLEHVEPTSIDEVLRDISRLTREFCYLVIDLQPAVKSLPDGRNAHILLAPADWWLGRVAQLFACQTSFPIFHECGLPQKLVIAASHRTANLPLVYAFLIKLNLFSTTFTEGVLGGVAPVCRPGERGSVRQRSAR
jgi:hypothetical protein